MKVLHGPWHSWARPTHRTAVTIGVLDGVHLGHQRLLRHLLNAEGEATVLTFDPHPVEVLMPGTHPRLITTLEERLGLLATAGIATVVVLDLAEIRELTAQEFVSDVLVARLRCRTVVVGVDFQFGRNRTGSVATLHEMSEDGGFGVDVVHLVEADGTISSSRVRGLIETGRVGHAAQLLGHPFEVSGVVVDGDKRGREIGFPTANFELPARKVIPGDGIYAAWATVAGERRGAAVNVGVRPTFGGGARLIEAYLLDYDRNIYGETLRLEFVEKIRDELAFDSVGELVARMASDVEETRSILGL